MISMKAKRNRSAKRLTAQEREDERDLAIIRRESRKPTYSFNEFMRELGYHDLVTPRRKRR